jgi:hypothetical protein
MLKEYWFDNEDKFNKQAEKLRNALSWHVTRIL